MGTNPTAPDIRVFFRIVKTDPPTPESFLSYQAQGRQLRRSTPATRRMYEGVSVYDTEQQAKLWAEKRPYLGAYVAQLHVHATVAAEQTGMPGHFTVWADPDVLLGCVARVTAV